MHVAAKRAEGVWNSANYALIKPSYSVSVLKSSSFQPTEDLNVPPDWSINFLIRPKEAAFEEVEAFNQHYAGLKSVDEQLSPAEPAQEADICLQFCPDDKAYQLEQSSGLTALTRRDKFDGNDITATASLLRREGSLHFEGR